MSAADGVCERALFIISGGAEPLGSAAGWIKAALDMLDQDEPETGRGSWGRDSELEDEPTLLHDSDPEKKKERERQYFHFPAFPRINSSIGRRAKTPFSHLIGLEELIANSRAFCKGKKSPKEIYNNFSNYLIICGSVVSAEEHKSRFTERCSEARITTAE